MRLIHFADLHLGIENYGRLDSQTGLHTRLLDFVRSLEFVINYAIDRNADAVLFAGDVYRNANPNPTWQREFAQCLLKLQQAAIPLAITVGNHDIPAAYGRATSVDVFGALDLEGTLLIRSPGLHKMSTQSGILQIAGLPWPTRQFLRAHDNFRELGQEQINLRIRDICAAQIEQFSHDVDPALPAVLLAHVTAAEAVFSGSERSALIGLDPTLLTSTLAQPTFDYVALGHVHRHQILNQNGNPPVVYPGSIERIDFGEEADTKGFCEVEIGDGEARSVSVTFVPTPARRFLSVHVDARGEDPTAAVLTALKAAAIKDAVVRVTYSCEIDGAGAVDLAAVRDALRGAYDIAGILPQIENSQKTRRAAISEHVDLLDALDRYIDNDPTLADKRDILRRYAVDLEQELIDLERT